MNNLQFDVMKFKDVSFDVRSKCLICEKELGEPVISLPNFPMTEIYVQREVPSGLAVADQYFHFCDNCGHGQLQHVLDMDLQYGDSLHYHFRTSESGSGKASVDFFVSFLRKFIKDQRFGTVVELGGNDLYLLNSIKDTADKLIGIDPMLKGREAEYTKENIVAIGDFFENVEINENIDVVVCKDTLEHVSEPFLFVSKIVEKAHDETLFFFEFPMLDTLLGGCRFDQIFHQHLNYFSLQSTIHMLERLGCELLDYTISENHWGGILIAFKKSSQRTKFHDDITLISKEMILQRYDLFKQNMRMANDRIKQLAEQNKVQPKGKIYGYGAALMLPVLSYHMENDFSDLECIIDDDPNKKGLSYINLPVTIKPRTAIVDVESSTILITAIASKKNVRTIMSIALGLQPKNIVMPLNTI